MIDEWSDKQPDEPNRPPAKALLLASRGDFAAAEAQIPMVRESAVTGFHLYPRYTRDAFLNRIRQSPECI